MGMGCGDTSLGGSVYFSKLFAVLPLSRLGESPFMAQNSYDHSPDLYDFYRRRGFAVDIGRDGVLHHGLLPGND